MNIYLDNAATTPLRKEVLDAMLPYLRENYGNPSSIYKFGGIARQAIDTARKQISQAIAANPQEIYFTSSGTESINWAIKGIAERAKDKGNHIITSSIEHHAVLHCCQYLEKNGWDITYLPVDEDGLIDIENLKSSIRPDTVLISIMFANNEIGVIQPISEIGAIARENGIIFHTDAVQAAGREIIDVETMCIDLLSISAHKLYGSKGIGALYIRKGVNINNFIHGGAQERNRRAGTENVAGIVGFGLAMEIAETEREAENARQIELRDYFIEETLKRIPYSKLNGHAKKRLCGNINISFDFIEGESMLIMLDLKGFSASSGSACTSGSLDPSHVLLALGLKHEQAHGSLRVSLGHQTTKEELSALIDALEIIVGKLREMSPLYEDFLKS
ncbi:MAG: cysteine desulfurase NifS [Defluviitaleaceae bacterium]|nr:cysteine desulfurase NifS [Defluviitaleaceae bacterium]